MGTYTNPNAAALKCSPAFGEVLANLRATVKEQEEREKTLESYWSQVASALGLPMPFRDCIIEEAKRLTAKIGDLEARAKDAEDSRDAQREISAMLRIELDEARRQLRS